MAKKKRNNTIRSLNTLFKEVYGDAIKDMLMGYYSEEEKLRYQKQLAKRKHDKEFKDRFEEELK